MSAIDYARSVLAKTDAAALHIVIEEVSRIEDSDALAHEYEGMRAELRGYGMEDDVAAEVISQFAGLVHAYRQTVQ